MHDSFRNISSRILGSEEKITELKKTVDSLTGSVVENIAEDHSQGTLIRGSFGLTVCLFLILIGSGCVYRHLTKLLEAKISAVLKNDGEMYLNLYFTFVNKTRIFVLGHPLQ